MSTFGLLAVGRSFGGGRQKSSPYRVDRRALPRFNQPARPTAAPAAPTVPPDAAPPSPQHTFSGARTANGSPPSALPRRLPGGGPASFLNPPAGTPSTAQAPACAKGAGDSFWPRRWFRRAPEPGGRQLSLNDVRVVRNDLRNADVEVLAPGRNGRPLRLAMAEWRRRMEALFRMGQ